MNEHPYTRGGVTLVAMQGDDETDPYTDVGDVVAKEYDESGALMVKQTRASQASWVVLSDDSQREMLNFLRGRLE